MAFLALPFHLAAPPRSSLQSLLSCLSWIAPACLRREASRALASALSENSSRVSLIDPCLPCRQHSLFSLFLAASLCGPAVISCPSPPLSCDGKRRCVRTNVISFGAERPTPAAAIYDDECRCVSHRLPSVSSPHHRTSSGAESTAQSSLSNFARPAHSVAAAILRRRASMWSHRRLFFSGAEPGANLPTRCCHSRAFLPVARLFHRSPLELFHRSPLELTLYFC